MRVLLVMAALSAVALAGCTSDSGTDSAPLPDSGSQPDLERAEAEAGTFRGDTAGASTTVVGFSPSPPVPFVVMGAGHGRLDITITQDDPAAALTAFIVHIYDPAGEIDRREVANGESVTVEDPGAGEWMVKVFPAGAGAWTFEGTFCAHAGPGCDV